MRERARATAAASGFAALALITALCVGPTVPDARADDPAPRPGPTAGAAGAFAAARFGLDVSLGVHSLLGKGPGVMERDRLPVVEYEKLPPRFNPTEFDADAWVKAARDSGARYLSVSAKHHDGFCLFDSRLTRYDVVDGTPFARDPLKALADACRKQKLPLFVSYSLLDWHHPDYAPLGETGRASGRDGKGEWARYLAYYQGQVRELCANYGPLGGVCLDGAWDRPEADWHIGETFATVRSLQPGAVVMLSRRRGADAGGSGADVETFAGALPAPGVPEPGRAWELTRALGGAPGHDGGGVDADAGGVVRSLVTAASRGANFRLVVSARADGSLPAGAVVRLAEVGRWLAANGESVYTTRPGPVPPQDWGVSTRKDGPGGAASVFLHVLKPGREVRLPGAALAFDARLIGRTDLLPQAQDGGRVVLTLPDPGPERVDTVVVLTPRLLDPPAAVKERR